MKSTFVFDFLDTNSVAAKPVTEETKWVDRIQPYIVTITLLLTFAESSLELMQSFRFPYAIGLTIIFLGIGLSFFLCRKVISTKKTVIAESNIYRHTKTHYAHSPFSRIAAKLLFFCTVILTIYTIYQTILDLQPVATPLSGQLMYQTSGEPIANASIKVLNLDGRDITEGFPKTDTDGHYVLSGLTPLKGGYRIQIIACGKTITTSVKNVSQQNTQTQTGTTLNHYILCQ